MIKKVTMGIAAIIFAAIPIITITGCSHSNDGGLQPAQVQKANRLDDIAQKSGGDWNKLSPDDKAYMLKAGYGSESTARMILLTRSGKFSVKAGAPTGHPATPPGVPTSSTK